MRIVAAAADHLLQRFVPVASAAAAECTWGPWNPRVCYCSGGKSYYQSCRTCFTGTELRMQCTPCKTDGSPCM